MPTPSSGTCWGGFTPDGILACSAQRRRGAWIMLHCYVGSVLSHEDTVARLRLAGYKVRKIRWEVMT